MRLSSDAANAGADVATLKLFHQFGPARNLSLRDVFVYENDVITQDDLDDLLVLAPKPPRPARQSA